jgi:rRNA-processing protein FCF1
VGEDMPEEHKKKGDYDIFIANSIYPEPAAVFTFRLNSLQNIMSDCCVVLDTNVLLAPYAIGKADLLDQCRETYSFLINQGRLVIPGQVAREFAKNRAVKLSELYQQFSSKKQKAQQIQSEKYPLLSSFEAYNQVIGFEREINTAIQEYKDAIDRILEQIQEWQWDDPVSIIYSELFTKDVVIELSLSNEDIIKDLERRHLHNISPSYKDAAKDDRGVGDLIIWHTILEIGEKRKKSIIFVSGDEKADWFYRSDKLALYPKYELVDEFRRASEGQSFHIIRFSRFLEVFGASEQVVEDVRQEEKTQVITKALQAYQAELAVLEWVRKQYPNSNVVISSSSEVDVDFRVVDNEQYTRGFVVLPLTTGRIFTPNQIASYSRYKRIGGDNELFIILVVWAEEGINTTFDLLEKYVVKEDNVTFIVGYVDVNNKFIDKYRI